MNQRYFYAKMFETDVKDIVSIQIDDIKAFSEVATEQINIMLDIHKVFHVYGQMPDCEPIIPRQVFTESKAFFKCQRHGETKNIRVSIRITTGKLLISYRYFVIGRPRRTKTSREK